ncbi:cupin domain-containing protein [Spirosoma agri]|uniref:cupin domain-containing protein n=1 Tax=Spirosoma agri TaxID=1987381 RepID=UPI001FEAADA4|nr:cupin domain-containing protein [Spirosoma agri]
MKLIILLSALLLLGNLRAHAQSTEKTSAVQTAIFPKGDKAPSENFTGTIWVRSLVPDEATYNCVVSSVTFEDGARSNRSAVRWHTHPAGQLLLITDGTGYYQERGKPIQLMHKGDGFKCPPNTEHWHGRRLAA